MKVTTNIDCRLKRNPKIEPTVTELRNVLCNEYLNLMFYLIISCCQTINLLQYQKNTNRMVWILSKYT